MDSFIRRYDDVITPEKCQYFIDKFEANPEIHLVQDNSRGATLTKINLLGYWTSTLGLPKPDTPFSEDMDFLFSKLFECVELYKEDVLLDKMYQWPKNYGIEGPKMKRYLPGSSDEFPDHVDVVNQETSRRFLVMFIYLTDNEAGTTEISLKSEYNNHKYMSFCKKGSCLIFPPMWPWLHAGRKPIKEPKYIIGSYLLYD